MKYGVAIMVMLALLGLSGLPSAGSARDDAHTGRKHRSEMAEKMKNMTPQEQGIFREKHKAQRHDRSGKLREKNPEAAARMKKTREEMKNLSPAERERRMEAFREERHAAFEERWKTLSDEEKRQFCSHAGERCQANDSKTRCEAIRKRCSGF